MENAIPMQPWDRALKCSLLYIEERYRYFHLVYIHVIPKVCSSAGTNTVLGPQKVIWSHKSSNDMSCLEILLSIYLQVVEEGFIANNLLHRLSQF